MSNTKLLRGRRSEPGTCYMVTTVLRGRRPLFLEPRLAGVVTAQLAHAADLGIVSPMAWVVMPDHVHWLFELQDGTLGACLQAFKSRTARAINTAAKSSGCVWQPGFYDHRLRSDEDLLAQARYVVANPLRRGLVSKIEDYPFWWCRWIAGSPDL